MYVWNAIWLFHVDKMESEKNKINNYLLMYFFISIFLVVIKNFSSNQVKNAVTMRLACVLLFLNVLFFFLSKSFFSYLLFHSYTRTVLLVFRFLCSSKKCTHSKWTNSIIHVLLENTGLDSDFVTNFQTLFDGWSEAKIKFC